MVKKKQKQQLKKRKEKTPMTPIGEKIEDYMIEVSKMQCDVKSFIKKFKSDADKKRKSYKKFKEK